MEDERASVLTPRETRRRVSTDLGDETKLASRTQGYFKRAFDRKLW